jgi:SAM-dependent methyltransferase
MLSWFLPQESLWKLQYLTFFYRSSMMNSFVSNISGWIKALQRFLRGAVISLLYHGKKRYCPVCGKSSNHFRPYGRVPRDDAQCAQCGALERHRLTWLFLQKRTNLFDGAPKKMLHVAPEPCFEPKLKAQLDGNYVTADLFDPHVMVKMDICDIQYPGQTFDVIYCSHVLEHVLDDKQAMREFFRVLKTDGWAILNVPITSGKTFGDSSILDPQERLKVFGQEDHVRRYGTDYASRLREAGFTVEIVKQDDLVNPDEATKMGLTPVSGEIYYCTKK